MDRARRYAPQIRPKDTPGNEWTEILTNKQTYLSSPNKKMNKRYFYNSMAY